MSLITNRQEVLELYGYAREKKWVLPCICSENLTTTEAVLSAYSEYAKKRGIKKMPVILAMTVNYQSRPQARHYTHTRKWDIGLRLFYSDIQILCGDGGPFEDLDVMVHLDHVQHDLDADLLSGDLRPYSSIMYDASALPFEENIRKTAEFVEKNRDIIVIEGACDEIAEASGSQRGGFTDPGDALRYIERTGADMAVCNLGTEHRAFGRDLIYRDDIAVKIKEKIGQRIVLHGASSVPNDCVENLFDDGICKVNIWTALERDTAPLLYDDMKRNEGKTGLPYFTAAYRNEIVFEGMKDIVKAYLELWFK